MGWVDHSGFDHQSLHQIKGLIKKILIPAKYNLFQLIFGNFFWYIDANFPSIFKQRQRTLKSKQYKAARIC